ncbi:MAG: hypothetical protein N3A38_17125, partial [Planctomycetota bacterium]|nr:hypothetical protein [Planctomycetota bacterium]
AARGQDFMLFQVLDRSELAPDIRPPDGGAGRPGDAVLRDPETGRAFPAWDAAMLRACREKVARHVEAVGRLCTEAGGDHMLVVTDEPFDRALWRFLDARARRR